MALYFTINSQFWQTIFILHDFVIIANFENIDIRGYIYGFVIRITSAGLWLQPLNDCHCRDDLFDQNRKPFSNLIKFPVP